MTYEEYGGYYPYQTQYRNAELIEAVKKDLSSMSIEEVKERLVEYALDDEEEAYEMNTKVLSGSEAELREFLFLDQKHLMMCHEDEDIDQYIEDHG